jgi:hypothetical protein
MVQFRSLHRFFVISAAAALVLLGSAPGHAQTSPTEPAPTAQPAATTAPEAPPPAAAPPPQSAPPPPASTATTTAAPPPQSEDKDNIPDHDRFIKHLAVGYFGVTSVPIANPNGSENSIPAPVLGVRYWISKTIGIDIGVGAGVSGGSAENNGMSQDAPTQTALLLHVGLPISFYTGKHYSFQLVPEANGGLAFATLSSTGNPDISLSGNRVDVGARIGSEIHFGFIDVPELALQGSIGLFFRRRAWNAEPDGGQSSGANEFGVATSVQGDPWAIFTNSISALYYF